MVIEGITVCKKVVSNKQYLGPLTCMSVEEEIIHFINKYEIINNNMLGLSPSNKFKKKTNIFIIIYNLSN